MPVPQVLTIVYSTQLGVRSVQKRVPFTTYKDINASSYHVFLTAVLQSNLGLFPLSFRPLLVVTGFFIDQMHFLPPTDRVINTERNWKH